MITVGQFSLDENYILSGPTLYMNEQGNALTDQILAGMDTIYNTTRHLSPNMETAILVRLQTDYAGWLGMKQITEGIFSC